MLSSGQTPPGPILLLGVKVRERVKGTGEAGSGAHLADKDEGLPPRPLGASAEVLHQLVDEVHSEGRRGGRVQLLHHLTDLPGEGEGLRTPCAPGSHTTAY